MRKLLAGILLIGTIITVQSSVQAAVPATGNGGNVTQTTAPATTNAQAVEAPKSNVQVVQVVETPKTKDMQGIYEQCGIGGLLFPSWPIGASVSNFTWDLGTTASTSGLTTPGACAGGKAKLAAYIYKSYDSIEKDLAKGEGKYVDMLALLSEKSPEQKVAFIQSVRNKFREEVAKNDYSSLTRLAKAKIVYSIVQEQS